MNSRNLARHFTDTPAILIIPCCIQDDINNAGVGAYCIRPDWAQSIAPLQMGAILNAITNKFPQGEQRKRVMKLSHRLSCILTLVLVSVGLSTQVFAMDRNQEEEFTRILKMPLTELTEYARNTLKKRYPEESWAAYRFPDYVFTNDSAETGYKIAVKRPELLAKFPCACACNLAGHKNLLDCFLKNGKPGAYDKHASFCTICYTQAMLAFLWAELGATDHEMLEGMKKRFAPEKRP